MSTEFYLANRPQEFKDCHEILDKLGRKAAYRLSFPTIIGKREGKIIAFVSTRPVKREHAVVLGELGIDPAIRNPLHVIVKLLEAYDAFLFRAGVTSYLACVSLDNPEFLSIIEKASGVKPYTQDSKWAWINRRIA